MLFFSVFNVAKANPYLPGVETAPPEGTKPQVIMLLTPQNETTIHKDSVLLTVNVTVGASRPYKGMYTSEVNKIITEVYYYADWIKENFTVYLPKTDQYGAYIDADAYRRTSVEFSKELTELPEENHTITIYTKEKGWYEGESNGAYVYQYRFYITEYATINFVVNLTLPTHTELPNVMITSPQQNGKFTSTVPLIFEGDNIAKIGYSLDGQENVTVTSNTTLTNLSNGLHTLTVYVWNFEGTVISLQSIVFSVNDSEPFLTPLVFFCVIFAFAACMGIIICLRKNRGANDPEGFEANLSINV
jgi:hypothetical protein